MKPQTERRNKLKVLVAMSLSVVLAGFGNIMLSIGMRCASASGYECAREAIIGTLRHPHIIIGIVSMAAGLLLYLASLSWEDLSYVLPLTAGEYVLVTILAFVFLPDDVTPLRWAGSTLVAAGIALVARS